VETLTLAEELTLLAYDDGGNALVVAPTLDYGLAGALLMELALAGRIAVVDDRVTVTDPTPLGRPWLDDALAQLAGADRARRPKEWVDKLSKRVRQQVLNGLAESGTLRREDDKVLWIFPRTRYPAIDGLEPPAETSARQRLVAAVAASGAVEPRTAALCALVRAVRHDKQVFGELPRDRVKARLQEIAAGDWAAAATKKAIEEMEAAIIMVAIVAPVIIAGTS
jgi:hypothetical protein